jgi:hypothetical protein
MLLDQISIHAWIKNNEIKTENGLPIDFHTHRFLYDIYADRSPFICALKAAQIGFTTYQILKSAFEARNENRDIIYVLPTANDVSQFSGGKTNRIIDNNPCLQEWTNDKDSIEQKRFGKATIYYRGSWTERTALMISASKLIVDELDRCKPSIVEQYDSRLQHTVNPKKAFFSNPSLPEQGIHKYFLLSDQKKWHIKHSCGETYPMEENCIDYKQEKYICPKCGKEILDEERRMGEWIATSKGEWSGYWIPLWINPMFAASKIAVYKREKTPEYFSNFVAGLPYINTNDALSQKILERNLTSEINERTSRTIIGMDTGHNIHYVMRNKQGAFYHGYCPSVAEMGFKPGYDPYNEIEQRLIEDKTAILMCDQGGDLIGIRKLQAKYPGRVYLVWFVKETKNKELMRWGENAEYGKVLVDRNRMIQMAVDYFKEERMSICGTKDEWQPYFNHWLNIYRVKEVQDGDENEPLYAWRWVWKRKAGDHFAIADVYALVGLERFAEDLAQIIGKDKFMAGVPVGSNVDGTIQARRTGRYNVNF